MAEDHAHAQFASYDDQRRQLEATQPTSDFDKVVDETKKLEETTSKPKKPGRKKKSGEE